MSAVLRAAPTQAQIIYWHHFEPGTSSKIKRANLDGSNPENVIDLGTLGVGDIAIDQSGGKIYWSEQARIRRASLDGTEVETFLDTGDSPGALAIDEVNQRIYWGRDEKWNYGINRATLDGQTAEEIVFIGPDAGAEGIAVDAEGGKIYFAVGRVFRANLDGTQNEVLISEASQGWTPDLVLDPLNRKLYWTDHGGNSIRRASLDGTGLEILSIPVSHPYKLAIDACNQFVYWNEAPGGPLGPARRARIDGQQLQQIVPSGVNYLAITTMLNQATDSPVCVPTLSASGIIVLAAALTLSALMILRSSSRTEVPSTFTTIFVLFVTFPSWAQSSQGGCIKMHPLLDCALVFETFEAMR